MTYNRDNIVGVEFTVKGERFIIKEINMFGLPVIEWLSAGGNRSGTPCSIKTACDYLNNGTWIVKNSNV